MPPRAIRGEQDHFAGPYLLLLGERGQHLAEDLEARNRSPKSFVWTASAQHILDKVAKAKETLGALH